MCYLTREFKDLLLPKRPSQLVRALYINAARFASWLVRIGATYRFHLGLLDP